MHISKVSEARPGANDLELDADDVAVGVYVDG